MEYLEFSKFSLNPYSLGMVAEFVSRSKPFDDFEFSRMMRSLSFQLSQGSNLIAHRNDNLIGYLGWIYTTDKIADDWISNSAVLEPAPNGEVAVITIFSVEDKKIILKMIHEAKRLYPAKRVVWRRYFPSDKKTQIRQVIRQ